MATATQENRVGNFLSTITCHLLGTGEVHFKRRNGRPLTPKQADALDLLYYSTSELCRTKAIGTLNRSLVQQEARARRNRLEF